MSGLNATTAQALLARIDSLLAEVGDERLLGAIRDLQPHLAALEQKLSSGEEETSIDESERIILRKALYMTSREVKIFRCAPYTLFQSHFILAPLRTGRGCL